MTEITKDHSCVIGLGWGDEGKGKIVDLLGRDFDVVVRYNGGANAGHTVRIGEKKFGLHLIPIGLLQPGVTGLIGPGVVVDPHGLLEEIDELTSRSVEIGENLRISDRAHVVMPYHKLEDQLREEAASGSSKIGTTARGIGPCYADKAHRSTAVRMCDLMNLDRHKDRIREIVRCKQVVFESLYGNAGGLAFDSLWDELTRAAERISPFLCDTTDYLYKADEQGKAILFEGANGTLLDLNFGTFPFVTSSHTGANGIAAGAGVSPQMVKRVVGVVKAYATRVGSGPFMTEQDNAIGEDIRQRGNEFGTTTGRPRRCGWFDAAVTRYSARLNGVTELAMQHIDTLSGIEKICACVDYELDGKPVCGLPADATVLERLVPKYEEFEGWSGNLRDISRFEDLPEATKTYIRRIEEIIGVPITMIGVGPERSQTIYRVQA